MVTLQAISCNFCAFVSPPEDGPFECTKELEIEATCSIGAHRGDKMSKEPDLMSLFGFDGSE